MWRLGWCAARPPLWCVRIPTRLCSHGPRSSPSAVNVESFTLNEDVVQADLSALRRWNALSASLDAARAGGRHAEVLSHVSAGLSMLSELGPARSPVQCAALLHLEAAQAHLGADRPDAAMAAAETAEAALLDAPNPDAARRAEVRQLMADIHLRRGDAGRAEAVLVDVLRWIDTDARRAAPMEAVAAANMRREVLSGIGHAQRRRAADIAASGGDGREAFAAALDRLIEALSLHVDEDDTAAVKATLRGVMQCFVGVGDTAQAVTTGEKYIRWCERHADDAGVAQGKEWLEELKAKHTKTS